MIWKLKEMKIKENEREKKTEEEMGLKNLK